MSLDKYPMTKHFFDEVWAAAGGDPKWEEQVSMEGEGISNSSFYGSDLACGVYAALSAAVSELIATAGVPAPFVVMNRPRSSSFNMCNPQSLGGWRTGPRADFPFDWYKTADDRWLLVCTPYQPQKMRTLTVLGSDGSEESIAASVKSGKADELEDLILKAGGFAAVGHTMEEWSQHKHGKILMDEPYIDVVETLQCEDNGWRPTPQRPLAGIRVLDCTRLAAGPAATRFLAGLGAEVLRIDPPVFEEWFGIYETLDQRLGKRCARLDIKSREGHEQFLKLLSEADIFIHGLRPGALDNYGLEPETRDRTRPGLVEACLNAYGWGGPWRDRRGYDSAVLTSAGVTLEEGEWAKLGHPRNLGVQVADYAAGYSVAVAAVRGLTRRLETGMGTRSRTALGRSVALLAKAGRNFEPTEPYLPAGGPGGPRFPADPLVHSTANGPVRFTLPPFEIDDAPIHWDHSSELLGSSEPRWASVPGGPNHLEWWSAAAS